MFMIIISSLLGMLSPCAIYASQESFRKMSKQVVLLKERALCADRALLANETYRQCAELFDTEMKRAIHVQTHWPLNSLDSERYEIFRDLFARTMPLTESSDSVIPKIIHQIWIGSEPPVELLELAETVRAANPDFEYRLWRDQDILQFGLHHDPAFCAATNWGERADILRYHILNTYGGVYADIDFIGLRSFQPLICGVDFVIGISNVLGAIEVANGFIACTPGNRVIQEILKGIVPTEGTARTHLHTIMRTGPQYVTRVICALAQAGYKKILPLPVSYIYPLPNTYHGPQSDAVLSQYVTEKAFCIHLWECRWINPQGVRN
jgi:mannosyltransferase OCH1-like enzyme